MEWINYISSLTLVLLYIILQYSWQCFAQNMPAMCNGSFGKCDGKFKTDTGVVKPVYLPPNMTIVVKNTLECRSICLDISWCSIARFSSSTSTCCLFDDRFRFEFKDSDDMLYVWICCEKHKLCSENPIGKCPGYWSAYEEWELNPNGYAPLRVLTINSCVDECARNIWCVNVGYDKLSHKCTLWSKWDMKDMRWIKSNSTWTYQWNCCHRHVKSKVYSPCHFQNAYNICKGYWTLDDKESKLPYNKSSFVIVGDFFTLIPYVCLQACEANSNCAVPFYNQTTGHCVLLSKLYNNSKISDKTYQFWKWECCVPKKYKLRKYDHDNCICVHNKSQITLYYYKCDDSTNEIANKNVWPDMPFIVKITLNSYNNTNMTLVTDGYHTYWLQYFSEKAVIDCPESRCKLNNASWQNIPISFVTRYDWFAERPVAVEKLILPVKYVIVLDTFIPHTTCNVFNECIFIIKTIQKYYIHKRHYADIPYNFLIGNDGSIFEGRGWNFCGAHSGALYNKQSIGVAFIGAYINSQQPSAEALTAFKALIRYGFLKKYLANDFILVGQRDITKNSIPGINLYRLIQSLPHYWKELDKPPMQCWSFPLKEIFIGTISGLSLIILFIISAIYVKYKCHNEICHLLHTSVSDKSFFYIVPLSNTPFNVGFEMRDSSSVKLSLSFCDSIFLACQSLHHECHFTTTLSHILADVNMMPTSALFNKISSLYYVMPCANLVSACFVVTPKNRYDLSSLIILHCEVQNIESFGNQLTAFLSQAENTTVNMLCQCVQRKRPEDVMEWSEINKIKFEQPPEIISNLESIATCSDEDKIDLLVKMQRKLEKANVRGRVFFAS